MILVAVGANLSAADGAAPRSSCERALALLAADGFPVIGRSRWYRSAPWPRSDQPDYVNGVVRIEARESPEALLRRLHAIERRMGRVREATDAARVIDLDLLAFGTMVRGADGEANRSRLRLPHPRLQERAFVLFPLREVAPRWTHPVTGRSVDQMIADLANDQECVPLEDAGSKMRKTL
jgi:2-amino-4-hydroxy-6-hydroxymethyldihydropteridine diphosphokinase